MSSSESSPRTQQQLSHHNDAVGRPPYRVIYIAGTGRSGSTLVAQYLEQRTRAVHVGEVRYVWQRGIAENHLCECGSPFHRCEFWTEVLSRAYGGELATVAPRLRDLSQSVVRMRRIPQSLMRIGSSYQEGVREYSELLLPLYDEIARVSGSDLIIDSSKDPSYLYALAGVNGLNLEAVHLVRDSRAVAYSWTRKRLRPEIHWRDEYMRTLTPRRSALIWLEYNAAIELFTRRRETSSRLRYEDFAHDPDVTTRGICESMGVRVVAHPAARGTGHSLSGNPMRFERGPLVVRLDREWEVGLPKRDQRTVTALTMPLLHRYGYRLHT